MRYTLIQLVQRILESMDSDEVNSVTDTVESMAVANIIKECYFDILSESELKETQNVFHLDASTSSLLPTVMTLPSHVLKIDLLKYNIGPDLFDTNYRELQYVTVDEFFKRMNGLDVLSTWVFSQTLTIGGQQFMVKYRNDKSPSFWTSTDDRTILFDSFDSKIEDTVTSSRTFGYGMVTKKFDLLDEFVPDIDPRQFQLLLNMAKAQSFVELKQARNELAEVKIRRHTLLAQKTQDATDNRTNLRKHKGFGR